jgi:hypothetical protein
MLPLRWAGAQHSQSPVGADMGDGDGTNMRPKLPGAMVNIAHFSKKLTPAMAAGSIRTMRGEGVSFGQVKKPSLLALDASDRTIGDLLAGLPVQRHPD